MTGFATMILAALVTAAAPAAMAGDAGEARDARTARLAEREPQRPAPRQAAPKGEAVVAAFERTAAAWALDGLGVAGTDWGAVVTGRIEDQSRVSAQ